MVVIKGALQTALVSAPSMMRLVPQMPLATGPARCTMPGAIFCAVPIRPVRLSDIAVYRVGIAALDILPDAALEIGVAGPNRFTRIPLGASWWLSPLA